MKAAAPPDPRFTSIRVDNNFFDDAIGPNERSAADKLIELGLDGSLVICTPHTVATELQHPNTPAATRRRFARLPFTIDTGLAGRAERESWRNLMRGNAIDGKHDVDASHLADTAAWFAGYFVTCDARIHRRQTVFRQQNLRIWIVRPTELVAIYEHWCSREPDARHWR